MKKTGLAIFSLWISAVGYYAGVEFWIGLIGVIGIVLIAFDEY